MLWIKVSKLAGSILILMLASTASASATTADAPEFCHAAKLSKTQKITCDSPNLWPLVAKAADARTGYLAEFPGHGPGQKLEDDDVRWRDENCHDAKCLREWYESQISFWAMETNGMKDLAKIAPNRVAHMAAYDAALNGFHKKVALAYVAVGCRLRSWQWYQSIGESYTLTRIDVERKIGLTAYEHASADSHDHKIEQSVFAANPIPASCDRLRNSPAMDDLDALQSRATGGYH